MQGTPGGLMTTSDRLRGSRWAGRSLFISVRILHAWLPQAADLHAWMNFNPILPSLATAFRNEAGLHADGRISS